ncbi:hypothetical protein [Salipiger sp.]|uniref:hypothetical protein n=1 Tax=Salipiger sp. TaxID=2078585 RepID=UPI003A97AAA8
MKRSPHLTAGAALCAGLLIAQGALAADEAQMMTMCNTYAAHHLHVSTSDIVELSYEGQRTDGTHAVNGSAANGQTFQCSFNSRGTHVVSWVHSSPTSCPFDVSEADRYMYPACD